MLSRLSQDTECLNITNSNLRSLVQNQQATRMVRIFISNICSKISGWVLSAWEVGDWTSLGFSYSFKRSPIFKISSTFFLGGLEYLARYLWWFTTRVIGREGGIL